MSHVSELIATDIDAYLAQHEQKELLRFITCGSVDDGMSTLIGRLTLPEIIQEMLLAKTSERQGRVIDNDEEGSMEDKKKEGYF